MQSANSNTCPKCDKTFASELLVMKHFFENHLVELAPDSEEAQVERSIVEVLGGTRPPRASLKLCPCRTTWHETEKGQSLWVRHVIESGGLTAHLLACGLGVKNA